MALGFVAFAAMTAPALWKLDTTAILSRSTPVQPDLVDGTDRPAPGMDDTDVECPPRQPALRSGRSRLMDSGSARSRIIAESDLGRSAAGAPQIHSMLASAQPSFLCPIQGGVALRLRI